MQNQPIEIIIVYIGTIFFWISVVSAIWFLGERWKCLRPVRDRMRGQWRPALMITLVYLVSALLSGRGFNLYGIAIFCQALIGLAIARGIPNLAPIPVIESIRARDQVGNNLSLFVILSLVAGVLGLFLGSLAMGIMQTAFHETVLTKEIIQKFPASKLQMFFLFLAGGGIAEELVHRLVLLSLLWALTKRPWFAIIFSALVHSGYHFTLLNPLHSMFLQFPVSQFVSGVVIGILWGYVFMRRGFETVALAHTLSDWLPMLFLT